MLLTNLHLCRPKINQDVSIDVTATEDLTQLTYQILGRGDVIISRTIQVPQARSFNFKFLASFAMVPKASLVVYYIRPDGEIISDQLKIEFGDELQNSVSASEYLRENFIDEVFVVRLTLNCRLSKENQVIK